MDFVAAIDAYNAHILAGGLGAIARATRDRQLDLGRGPRSPHELFQSDAEARGVLGSEPAPVGADAGFHGSQTLGIGMSRDHAGGIEISPNGRQVILLDPEKINALAAGDLDRRDLELVGDVGDGAQFVRRGHAAPHARYDRVGAVLLDIGVGAFIDEARLLVVGIVARPSADQVVVERRSAGSTAIRGGPFQGLHDRQGGLQAVNNNGATHNVMGVVGAFAHRGWAGLRLETIAERQFQQLLHQRRAGAAGGRGLGHAAHGVQGGQALAGDCAGDLSLANAVAAADLLVVGHGRNGRTRVQA